MQTNLSVAQAQANLAVVEQTERVSALQRRCDELYKQSEAIIREQEQFNNPTQKQIREINALKNSRTYDYDQRKADHYQREAKTNAQILEKYQKSEQERGVALSALNIEKAKLDVVKAQAQQAFNK